MKKLPESTFACGGGASSDSSAITRKQLFLDAMETVYLTGWLQDSLLLKAIEKKEFDSILSFLSLHQKLNRVHVQDLHMAIKQNLSGLTKLLLESGVGANREENTAMLIHVIEKNGGYFWSAATVSQKIIRSDIIDLLLQREVDLKPRDISVFVESIRYNQVDITRKLLIKGAAVNEPDFHGETPMFRCAEVGNPEMAQLLLSFGADINYVMPHGAKQGQTVLTRSVISGEEKLVKLFLENGAARSINLVDRNGNSPWSASLDSSIRDQWNTEIVKLLIEHGANLEEPVGNYSYGSNAGGKMPPLLYAIQQQNDDLAILLLDRLQGSALLSDPEQFAKVLKLVGQRFTPDEPKYFEFLKALAVSDANFSRLDQSENNPLSYASTEVAELFLDKITNPKVLNALFVSAIRQGKEGIVEKLLAHGTDVKCIDAEEGMLLMSAVKSGNTKVVELLLANGLAASINQKDEFGNSAWSAAFNYSRHSENLEIINLLLEYTDDPRKEIWEEFKYSKPTVYDNRYSALEFAVTKNNPDLVKLLLNNGETCDVFEILFRYSKTSPKISQLLLQTISDVNSKDHSDKTVLMYAAEKWLTELVTSLLENGADVTAKDGLGKTALEYAAQAKSIHVSAELIKAGAEIDDINKIHASTSWITTFKESVQKELSAAEQAEAPRAEHSGGETSNQADHDHATDDASALLTQDDAIAVSMLGSSDSSSDLM